MPPSHDTVRRAAVFTHRTSSEIETAVEQLERVAEGAEVELVYVEPEREPVLDGVEVALVLGGDGTILRALHGCLGTGIPVVGVNFGRVGFLTTAERGSLEAAVTRVFAGELQTVELPTLELQLNGSTSVAVNDVVATSGSIGRMVELAWAIGDENLGVQPCDGLICATPSGSTAYNLSNGGPVLVWGLDAMVMTFVAPHSLSARPLVVGRGADLTIWNRTADVSVGVLVDGREVGELAPGAEAIVRLGEQRSLLGSLPGATFFTRYRHAFGH